jgi:thiamine transporter
LVLDSFAFVVNPIQVALDYPLAFGALGLAGFFRNSPIIGVVVGVCGRFVCHFISGLVFFAMYAQSGLASMGIGVPEYVAPVVYSIVYNGSFLIVELVMSAVVIFVLQKRNILKLYM